ncbi:hypothetical protein [Limnoglobus roseus]|uniref:Uncharacterized protein n=1 Tax=Limnoglobus roseus TaxID=2598579 RepID=A0A5C1AP52_9BACT|nr:hypothetical protein [Limnoglobus roseus]QEL20780.1 hypothetical protein PX52LOC_07896 [Limnoglobus roseus]
MRKIEAAVRRENPPAWPGVVFVLEATPDRPPGRWGRADGATEVLGYDPTVPRPDFRFPGNPLVLGGIDPFACDPELRAAGLFGVNSTPDRPNVTPAEGGMFTTSQWPPSGQQEVALGDQDMRATHLRRRPTPSAATGTAGAGVG